MRVQGIDFRENSKIPEIAGKYSGPVIALGSGPGVFEDIRRAQWWLEDVCKIQYHVIAANLSYLAWNGPLHHLVSLHQNKLPHFYELSEDLPVSRVGNKTHVHCPFPTQVEGFHLWDLYDTNGTSSLFALKVAILLGYDRIICCGMDLNGPHRFYDNPNLKTNNNFSCDAILMSWQQFRLNDEVIKKVRGLSGKPKELFGEVTYEWLKEK